MSREEIKYIYPKDRILNVGAAISIATLVIVTSLVLYCFTGRRLIVKEHWIVAGLSDRMPPGPLDGIKLEFGHDSWIDERFTIPYVVLLGLTLPLPIAWVHTRRLIRRRLVNGLCLSCGYNLNASKDRCPECGTPIDPANQPASPS